VELVEAAGIEPASRKELVPSFYVRSLPVVCRPGFVGWRTWPGPPSEVSRRFALEDGSPASLLFASRYGRRRSAAGRLP